MRNKFNSFISILVLGFFLTLAPANAKVVDSIALVVDQDALTQGEMNEAIDSYFAAQQSKSAAVGSPEYEAARKQVEEAFIREVLLAEEADREKIELQDGEVDHEVDNQIAGMKKNFATDDEFNTSLKNEGISVDDLRQDIRDKMARRIKAAHVLRDKQQDLPGSVVVTDSDVRKYYEQHPNDYDRVKFSMILLRLSPEAKPNEVAQVFHQAKGLVKQIKGGTNFANLAKKYSEDPGSAADGGDIGTVSRAEIGDPKLAEGVFALKAPSVGLVRATDGIYVVKVDSRGKADFGTAAGDIKTLLKKQKQDNAINTWVDNLKKNAYIVEDGKVVSSEKFMSSTLAEETAAANVPTTMTAEDEKLFSSANDGYPSLPAGGSWLPSISASGFLPDTTDLNDHYGYSTGQGFPFGLAFTGSMNYAMDPTWQVGLNVELLRKFSQSVTETSTNLVDSWNSTAVGASLGLKLLIPLDESTNFTLSAAGGIYTLLDASVTIVSTAGTNTNLSATDLGGQAGAGIEFILDPQKSAALDLGLDYRLLTFNPVTSSNAGFIGSPLTNAGGGNSSVDFSGFQVKLGVVFFLGSDSSGAPAPSGSASR